MHLIGLVMDTCALHWVWVWRGVRVRRLWDVPRIDVRSSNCCWDERFSRGFHDSFIHAQRWWCVCVCVCVCMCVCVCVCVCLCVCVCVCQWCTVVHIYILTTPSKVYFFVYCKCTYLSVSSLEMATTPFLPARVQLYGKISDA